MFYANIINSRGRRASLLVRGWDEGVAMARDVGCELLSLVETRSRSLNSKYINKLNDKVREVRGC